MSCVTGAELLRGAKGNQWREATLLQLDGLKRPVPVRDPQGPEICHPSAFQATAWKRRGTTVGANDLWIACTPLLSGPLW